MTIEPQEDTPRRGFPWKTTAIVALALNLLLIGVGVGALAAGARLTPPGPGSIGGGGAMTRTILDSLPEEKRRDIRTILGQGMKTAATERRAAREARVAAFKAAMAEPYDAAAVRTAFAQMRAADAAALGRFDDSLVVALGRLTPEERRAAMIELARRAQKGRGGPRRDGPGADRPDRPDPDRPPP